MNIVRCIPKLATFHTRLHQNQFKVKKTFHCCFFPLPFYCKACLSVCESLRAMWRRHGDRLTMHHCNNKTMQRTTHRTEIPLIFSPFFLFVCAMNAFRSTECILYADSMTLCVVVYYVCWLDMSDAQKWQIICRQMRKGKMCVQQNHCISPYVEESYVSVLCTLEARKCI